MNIITIPERITLLHGTSENNRILCADIIRNQQLLGNFILNDQPRGAIVICRKQEREAIKEVYRSRQVALDNVQFVTPGSKFYPFDLNQVGVCVFDIGATYVNEMEIQTDINLGRSAMHLYRCFSRTFYMECRAIFTCIKINKQKQLLWEDNETV